MRMNRVPFILLGVLVAFLLIRGMTGGGSAGVAPKPAVFAPMSFAAAQYAAQTDGKLLLVKVSADWCPPCQMMNRDTFVDAGVVSWLQQRAVTIEVDADHQTDLASQFNISSLPTMLVFAPGAAEPIARVEGYMSASELISWLEAANSKRPGTSTPPAGQG